jgi:hypothetical protein
MRLMVGFLVLNCPRVDMVAIGVRQGQSRQGGVWQLGSADARFC